MSRNLLYLAVFLVGLVAVCWIGVGYAGSNPLAAAVAALIGACYLAGAVELLRYRRATRTLVDALAGLSATPPALAPWLERLHPGLRSAVRLRVEGARVALPAPVLTPYLVGLLVLLGMLGTLLGMMATLRGTGAALESATDLEAIRGSLAAPVKGLGFAFGTSIAGVASSAMLGLLSALCRRERLRAVQRLDARIATTLRPHSQAHQRDEAFRLLQQQTAVMPALVERLEAMMAALERQGLAASERQLASQEAFHTRTEAVYQRLASSVEQSLKHSVTESARAAGAAFQPVVASTMEALARETASLHDTVTRAVQAQLEGVSSHFETSSRAAAVAWKDALAEASDVFREGGASMLRVVRESQADLQETLAARDGERLSAWTDALASMANALNARWERSGEELAARQKDICDALGRTAIEVAERSAEQAGHTIAEVSRLVEAATEAPRIAAQVVAELREKLSESMVRDTAMLEERGRLLATLETLLDAVNHASTEQRTAVDALVATSADLLDRVGRRFAEQVETEAGKLGGIAADITGSATEVANLGASFGTAVDLFGKSNEALMERLDRIAGALDASLSRSDEQLAYYVAQAREVVDLSVLSQKQIIEDLQRLAGQPSAGTEAA
jgi:DNA anti-recombination protein RmuC